MGNRILKETVVTSSEIEALSWFEEVFFYRLIVTVDDYGIYPANPTLLMHMLFPLKENVSRKAVEEALKHLEQLKLIYRYRVPGKGTFLGLTSWEKHQRMRDSRRKYPAPEEAVSEARADAAGPAMPAAETAAAGEPEIVPEKETKAEPKEEIPPVIAIPLNDGSEHGVTQQEVDEYAGLYPAVDVLQELRAMRGWCITNAKRRKTKYGIRRFINAWLARAQDSGRGALPAPSRPANPYLAMLNEGEVQ